MVSLDQQINHWLSAIGTFYFQKFDTSSNDFGTADRIFENKKPLE